MFLPNLKLTVSSTNLFVLQVYTNFIYKILQLYTKTISIHIFPVKRIKITLFKSPHVYKKSKEQYSIKTYRATILVDSFLFHKTLFNFFLLNKPKCVVLNFVLER